MSRVHERAGEVLASLRENQGLTQADLAESLGITPAHVSRIETGSRKITLDLIEKASDYFNVDPSVFLSNDPLAPSRSKEPRSQPSFEVGEYGRVVQCIQCGNMDIDKDDLYCIRCGFPVVNLCLDTKCRSMNRPQAERCSTCGAETAWSLSEIGRAQYVKALKRSGSEDKILVE